MGARYQKYDYFKINTLDVTTLLLGGTQIILTAAQINALTAAGTGELEVYNNTGAPLIKGALVYISGYNAANALPEVTKADADAVASVATLVLTEDIAAGVSGTAIPEGTVTGIDTSGAGAVGSLAYLSANVGEFAWVAPAGAGQVSQVVGVCMTKNALTGSIRFFPGWHVTQALPIEMLQTLGASADEIDQALDGIAAAVTAANLNALVGSGFTSLHKHKVTNGTPVNAVAATGTLTIVGVVNDGQTVTIDNPAIGGSNVHEFDSNASVTPGNIAVDISAGTKVQAAATLTLTGVTKQGETFTVISGGVTEVYEIDLGAGVTGGNKQVNLAASATAATQTFTFTGAVSDGETITIGNEVYEFDTNGSVTGNNIRVDVAASQAAAAAVTALVVAINVMSDLVTAADGAGDTAVITCIEKGTLVHVGQAHVITLAEACVNGSWAANNPAGGVDPAAAASVTAIVSAFNVAPGSALAITAADGAGDTVVFTCDAAGALDGSVGNSVTISETMGNGSWGGVINFQGGSDCTAPEAVTALVAAVIASDTQGVGAADGAGDTVVFTADTKGVAGNSITTVESMTNGSFAAGVLGGGVDGTVGEQWEQRVDATYIYTCIAANDITGTNWRRQALGAAY